MQIIEGLTDAEIAEAHRSADVFAEVQDMTAPLDALLCLLHALDWLQLNTRDNRVILKSYFTGLYGDPVQIAMGKLGPLAKTYQSGTTKAEASRLAANTWPSTRAGRRGALPQLASHLSRCVVGLAERHAFGRVRCHHR